MFAEQINEEKMPFDEVHDSADGNTLALASSDDIKLAMRGPDVAMSISGFNRHVQEIADWVRNNFRGISAGPGDWHNVVVEFQKTGEFRAAMTIIEAGRSRYPNSSALLADAIWTAGDLGDWDTGDQLVELAENDDFRTSESWTLSVYVATYLMRKASSQSIDLRVETYKKALDFLDSAIERVSPHDQILNMKAEVLLQAGRVEEARDLLEQAIFRDDYRMGVVDSERIPVAQCCVTYLKSILQNSCDYDKIIQVADAGIRFAATVQETVATDFFFYRKALALDGKVIASSLSGRGGGGSAAPDLIRGALQAYALTFALTKDDDIKQMCRTRFLIIGALGGVDGMSVDMYCPENTDGTSSPSPQSSE